MTRLQQLERDANSLTEAERAAFAAHLLSTLSVVMSDEDEGVAEALRREAEMDATGEVGISWNDLKHGLGR
ncbi:hypothetical protein [Synoicihabitans lomoniglobus]|uniref:Addiction module protein n=1 Tax=Synoicihabitans lomoniglobus TaxID=2909285 RepID=A0AAE9ZU88_9BACT|nr:addiction module protein [Opitutaceae bacterium LMO-M01]WED63386.1 addiction module protein [Opitutaceae bacterium LMO-M01]